MTKFGKKEKLQAKHTTKFYVLNKQGQFLKVDETVRHYGCRWTNNQSDATGFEFWAYAYHFANRYLPARVTWFIEDEHGREIDSYKARKLGKYEPKKEAAS